MNTAQIMALPILEVVQYREATCIKTRQIIKIPYMLGVKMVFQKEDEPIYVADANGDWWKPCRYEDKLYRIRVK